MRKHLHSRTVLWRGHNSGTGGNRGRFRLDSAMCPGAVITLLGPALSGGTCRKSECDCSVPGTSKHRRCDTAALVRVFLKPLFDLEYSNSAFFIFKSRCLSGYAVCCTYAFPLQKARKLIASCISDPHAFST